MCDFVLCELIVIVKVIDFSAEKLYGMVYN